MSNYVLKIVEDKDKLRVRSDETNLGVVLSTQVKHVIKEIKQTLKANKDLVALSAPQLGYNERIFGLKFANNDIQIFINPAIIRTEGNHLSREKSIGMNSDTEYLIFRPEKTFISYQTVKSQPDKCEMNKLEGFASDVFMQMNDLLNGVLIEDVGLEVLPGFDEASDEEKQEIIDMYIEHLKEIQNSVNEAIKKDSDSETARLNRNIEFMTKLQLGEIETVPLTEEEKELLKKHYEELNKEIVKNENHTEV